MGHNQSNKDLSISPKQNNRDENIGAQSILFQLDKSHQAGGRAKDILNLGLKKGEDGGKEDQMDALMIGTGAFIIKKEVKPTEIRKRR